MKQCLLLVLVTYLVARIDGSAEGPPYYNDPSGFDPNQYYSYMSDQAYRDYVPPVTPPNIPGGPPSQVGPGGSRPAAPPIPNGNFPDPSLGGPPMTSPPLPGPPLPGPPLPGPTFPGPPLTGPPLTGPSMPYPEIPQFYFNAGFNKGLGFRLPKELDHSYHEVHGGHSALGELWATKADMIPAIFKAGIFVTVMILLFRFINFMVGAKQDQFLLATPLEVAQTGPVPVVAVEVSKDTGNPSRKRRATATPAVDPAVDFDGMFSQLESTRARFDQRGPV